MELDCKQAAQRPWRAWRTEILQLFSERPLATPARRAAPAQASPCNCQADPADRWRLLPPSGDYDVACVETSAPKRTQNPAWDTLTLAVLRSIISWCFTKDGAPGPEIFARMRLWSWIASRRRSGRGVHFKAKFCNFFMSDL